MRKPDTATPAFERKICRDLFVGIIAVIILACAAYVLHLSDVIAEWTGRPEIAEIDAIVVVLVFSVWLVGIFLLRRVYDLRQAAAQQTTIAERAYQGQKMESLAKMAAGLAHDFNNLLTAILGFCSMAMQRPDTGDQVRKDLMEIKSAGDKAASLVQRLLSFGRKRTAATELLDLNQVMSEMTSMLKYLLGQKIELKTELNADQGCVNANLTQIEEILVNLCLNAHDAMPNGGQFTIGTASVTLDTSQAKKHAGLSPGQYVQLVMSDNGSGMAPEIKDHIFEPFFSTKEKGTGLGLPMVFGIVEQNGGAIEVESTPGAGTTFSILLPAASE